MQGNYNATATNVTGASVPAAIIGDAVTILSNNWSTRDSFLAPNDPRTAPASTPAIGSPWSPARACRSPGRRGPRPTTPFVGSIFGTDGGVGNFLRYSRTGTPRGARFSTSGSIVSLFISRQATGTFKCCPNVYAWGVRNYSFDTNFLTPALLPPGTPMFRDVNTLTFRQLLRPTE